ncbi:MAG: hypothetical protein C4532_17200 [Candidatus Abyssobacteria bacterium SURF_17]|uniref:Uncharacterized protein n=1 Tax=Candidatus Abyssobacteria bacterium SURF_17 TaxID=2093361 RepID=A0A419EQU9_9BACT|nr:MAG: hypothetical protein C4532_17200 [Candidatus Abyssubacteria bacterium SURF_17]
MKKKWGMPTWEQYDKACREYMERFELADRMLRGICKQHPGHSRYDEIYAKVFIIGRSYATQIERQIPASGQQGEAILKLADHYYRNRDALEEIFDTLAEISEPLNEDKLERIVREHARLIELTRRLTRSGNSTRSFVSKYMHFHCPAVPIFDGWADECLRYLYSLREIARPFELPSGADEPYYQFAVRFWNLYVDARKNRDNVTVKLCDNFLLWWWSD